MAPGFENGREEFRTPESVNRERGSSPQGDGDPRPLEQPMDPGLARDLDESRGLQIEETLRQKDRAGVQ